MIKAVTFDLDGTLYPYRKIVINAAPLVLKHLNFFTHFSRIRKEIRKKRPIADFRRFQAQLLSERMSIPFDRSYELIEHIVYGELVAVYKRIQPFPFIKDILFQLKGEGYSLGVLSDFPVKEKLEFLGLNGIWDCALCAEESNYLKPNPEPFLMLTDGLKVNTDEILYVGDKYYYDIAGAHQTGMRTAHLARSSHSQSLADVTFKSYREFMDLIKIL